MQPSPIPPSKRQELLDGLAERVGEGDPEAFAALLRTAGSQLHAVARGIVATESAAAAAVGEVFVELVSRPVRLQQARLSPIAVLLLDVRSHSLDRRPVRDRPTAAPQGTGDSSRRRFDSTTVAGKALLGLPHAERILLENLFWEGRSRRDSASELGLEVVEARRRGARGLIALGVRLGIPSVAALDVVAGEGEREAELVLRELEEQAGEADTAVDLQPFGLEESLRLGLLEAFARIGESVAAVRLPAELERKLARAYAGEEGLEALRGELPHGEDTQPAADSSSAAPPLADRVEEPAGPEAVASLAPRRTGWLWQALAVTGWLLVLGLSGALLFWQSELQSERVRWARLSEQAAAEAQQRASEVAAARSDAEELRGLSGWLAGPGIRAVSLRSVVSSGIPSATLFLSGARGWCLLLAPASRVGPEPLEVEFWIDGEPLMQQPTRFEAGGLVWFRGDRTPAGAESVAVFRRLGTQNHASRLRILDGELTERRGR